MAIPIRNVAIIAHVDHGKTTLVDGLLRTCGAFRENEAVEERVMDSGDLERERGITIQSKSTSVEYRGVRIQLVDTPGHADFGGEVERVLSMADGVILLVDAFEGPMPQTRFVLTKAFEHGLTPVIVINKVDRPEARPKEVVNEVFDLLIDLGADEDVIECPVLYASGRDGWASRDPAVKGTDMVPIFDEILAHVPEPTDDPNGPLQFRVSSIDHSDYVGRIVIGRVHRGTLRKTRVMHVDRDGKRQEVQVRGVFRYVGITREECDSVGAGDIAAIYGIENLGIGDSLTDLEVVEPLEPIAIDEPTISMVFRVNNSPFAGREGKFVTSRQLKERFERELRTNVALRVAPTDSPDAFHVSGRGLMHLGILAENMRREGFEFAVSPPVVLTKEVDGKKHEPIEQLVIDAPDDCVGKIIEFLGQRKAELQSMSSKGEFRHLEFEIPSRGLIGSRTRILNLSQGRAIMHHSFLRFGPDRGELAGRIAGVMIASSMGAVTGYAIDLLKDRGTFFVLPQTEVYEGMIVGEHCKENDIIVNIGREKKLTNIRSSTKEAFTKLTPPRLLSLEEALEYISDDELVEITPTSIRLRKAFLKEKDRKRSEQRA
ncbi:MAG: translational GTPase TypA [Planctomycetes bacterium]|nr:translational GTPase TypA [Planctomycetota bacterium]